MKNLNKLQQSVFSLEDIESIEDVGYKNCIDIEVEDDSSFILGNGIVSHNSAAGGCSSAFGRDGKGYYASRGVPINGYISSIQRFTANEEISDIFKILNLQLNGQHQNLEYENIVLANDADCDRITYKDVIYWYIFKICPTSY